MHSFEQNAQQDWKDITRVTHVTLVLSCLPSLFPPHTTMDCWFWRTTKWFHTSRWMLEEPAVSLTYRGLAANHLVRSPLPRPMAEQPEGAAVERHEGSWPRGRGTAWRERDTTMGRRCLAIFNLCCWMLKNTYVKKYIAPGRLTDTSPPGQSYTLRELHLS